MHNLFRIVFWDVLPCKMTVDSSLMMEAVRTSETTDDNRFTQQYIPEDNSEHHARRRENLKSYICITCLFKHMFVGTTHCSLYSTAINL
jgi:hypothetical protein